jgi:hypothetical protein
MRNSKGLRVPSWNHDAAKGERPQFSDCVEEVGVWRGDNRRLVCAESR